MIARLFELSVLLPALIVLAFFMRRWRMTTRVMALALVLVLPLLFLSVVSMNSLLTCDESYLIYEPVNLSADSLHSWHRGAFRTTDFIVGVPLSLVKRVTDWPLDILAVLGKTLRWVYGFLGIVLLTDALIRLLPRSAGGGPSLVVVILAIITLPVMNLAFKVFNYDLFSMIPAALAMAWLAAGWREGGRWFLYAGVIAAAAAAQEKLIAAPLLWAALVIAATALARRTASGFSPLRSFFAGSTVVLLAVGCMLVTFLAVAAARGAFPDHSIGSVFLPFFMAVWPVLRLFDLDILTLFATEYSVANPLHLLLFLVIIVVAISALASLSEALLRMGKRFVGSALLTRINDLVLILAVIVGMVSTYSLTAMLSPVVPVAEGAYLPSLSFNELFTHFGASSLWTHLVLSVCWAYAVFVNSFPSPVLGVAVVMAGLRLLGRLPATGRPALLELVFAAALFAPFLYAVFQIPVVNRYLNVFLLLVVMRCAYDCAVAVGSLSRGRGLAAAVVFALLLVAEILPFQPLFGAFRPVWSNYSSSYNTTPSPGILNPSWIGWGEEVALSGMRIERLCAKKGNAGLEGVRIYHNYMGGWLWKRNEAKLMEMGEKTGGYRYTAKDFYVLGRAGVTLSALPFPSSVTPLFTIAYRGFVEAWVFRGSDLAEAGFSFSASPEEVSEQGDCYSGN